MNRRTVLLWVAGLLVATLGSPAFAGLDDKLAGLWVVEGYPNPESGVPNFVNVTTMTRAAPGSGYAAKGQIVNLDPSEGATVGGWERLDQHTYAVTFTGFLPPADGVTLRVVVHATAELHAGGDHFSGPFRTDVLDLDGNVVFSFEGTVFATRQPIEPF
jgi:hypothetical protein